MEWKKVEETSSFIQKKDRELLKKCKKYYSAISVGYIHEEVKTSTAFPSDYASNSVFGDPIGSGEIDGWPAIWSIVKGMNIGNGGGNNNQYSLKSDHGLTKAIYKQIDGEWHYHLHPEVVKNKAEKFGL